MQELKIVKLDHQGRGIGYIDHKITFVEDALPEETVFVEIIESYKNYNIARKGRQKNFSEKRRKPFCPYWGVCGGCHLEHLSYEDTLFFKKEKVKNIMSHEHVTIPEIEILENESPKNYRNKLTLKVQNGQIGFYEEKTHHIIEIKNCYLAKKSINKCLKKIKKLQIQNGEITIRSNSNAEILLIINTKDKVSFVREDFKEIKLVGVILNNKTIYGQNFFYERMNNHLFKISYDAFFQINPYITSKLFKKVEENIDESQTVLDLYAGVGTLGMIAKQKAKKVYSIEIIKNAVLNNIENIKLNKKENIFPLLGDAGEILPKINEQFDMIIIDPPRKGLDKNSVDLILKQEVKKIIYISCDPMTLARDLKKLTEKYRIEKFYIFDMFSYTYHVESMVVLNWKENAIEKQEKTTF